jgi:tetratricopeptide (TPR) repeat protein
MNENEKLFLEVIKESDGVLEDIYEKLNSLGEIKDDISIIRVEYFPLDQKKTEEETSPREILNYIRKYQYSEAMQILDRIPPNEFPGLNYYRGYCLERLGRGVEAIPFLKKGIFHTSTDLHSLRLLAKIYYRAGKFREALEFIEEASALNPKNENVQKELQKIKFRAFRNV